MSILINNTSTESHNVLFTKGFRDALFGNIEYKPLKYNENRLVHGSQPVSLNMYAKRRDKISLKIYILNATSNADAMAKFQALHSVLNTNSYTTITVDNTVFTLKYIGYTALKNFGKSKTATLLFAEPNPNNRTTV